MPKLTVVVGVTVMSERATPLTCGEQPLSLPESSTAVMRMKYVVVAVRLVIRLLTVWPEPGESVVEATAWLDPPGQSGAPVSMYTR